MMKKWAMMAALTMLSACVNPPANESIEDREVSLLHLADTMKRGGDMNSAIDLYKRAIAQSGNRVQAHMALADLYNQMDQPRKAIDVLLRAKKRQRNHPLINLGLGKLAIAEEEAEKAILYFDDGLIDDAENLDLLNGKAVALDMIGEHKQAQQLYYQIIDLDSSDTDFVQSNLAMSHIMNGDYDDAIAQLRAVKNMEESAVMRQNLALAYGLKGEMKKAREWGLKDLKPKEFEENIKFYKSYTKQLRARQNLD